MRENALRHSSRRCASAGDWQTLDLRNIPAASPTREILSAAAASSRLPFTSQVEEVCPVITLGASFEAYLESLDKKQRHEIRRKTRKAYDEAEIRWHCVDGTHDLDEAVEQFVELHQRSKAGKDEFMTPAMVDFFRALARVTYEAGWLELAFIAVNGRQAATYFNFVYNDATLCYNSGYDPQAYAATQPRDRAAFAPDRTRDHAPPQALRFPARQRDVQVPDGRKRHAGVPTHGRALPRAMIPLSIGTCGAHLRAPAAVGTSSRLLLAGTPLGPDCAE